MRARVSATEDSETEDSSTENVEEHHLLKESKRNEALARQNSIPKTLPNFRASLVLASAHNSRPGSGTNTPSSSPRKRTVSENSAAASRTTNVRSNDFLATRGAKNPSSELLHLKLQQHQLQQQQQQQQPVKVNDEEEERKRELALLEFRKEFIKGSLKAKTYEARKMVAGDVTFFDDGLGSDFCVTAKSSPYSTPPPEKVMTSDVSRKEISLLKIELKKVKDQVTYMSQQQAKINLTFIEIEKEKKRVAVTTSSNCSLF